MARKVIIRRGELNTAVFQLEQLVRDNYKDIVKQHHEDLYELAQRIVNDANQLVPVKTGKLKGSIKSEVSRSNRYPGIRVSASAKRKGFDYALIQEENEYFEHINGGQAHYLRDAFGYALNDYWKKWTGHKIPRLQPVEREFAYTYNYNYYKNREEE